MSQKRVSKRRRDSGTPVQEKESPFRPGFPPKRSRSEDDDNQASNSSTLQLQDINSTRRSSRKPKPKALDDNYVDTGLSSPKAKGPFDSPILKSFQGQSPESAGLALGSTSDTHSVRRSSRAPKPKKLEEDFIESGVRSPKDEHAGSFSSEVSSLQGGQPTVFTQSQSPSMSESVRRSSRPPKPKRFDDEGRESNLSSPRSEVESEISTHIQSGESSPLAQQSNQFVRKSSRPPKPKKFDDGFESNISSPRSNPEEEAVHFKFDEKVRKSSRAPKPKRFDDEDDETTLCSPRIEKSIAKQVKKSETTPGRKSLTTPKPKLFVEQEMGEPGLHLISGKPQHDKTPDLQEAKSPHGVRRSFRPPKPKILDDTLPCYSKSSLSPGSGSLAPYEIQDNVDNKSNSAPMKSNPKGARKSGRQEAEGHLHRETRRSYKEFLKELGYSGEEEPSTSNELSFKTDKKDPVEKGPGDTSKKHIEHHFDDVKGHKRETRRSYKDYLKELGYKEERMPEKSTLIPEEDAEKEKHGKHPKQRKSRGTEPREVKDERKEKKKYIGGKEEMTGDKSKKGPSKKLIASPESLSKSQPSKKTGTPEQSPGMKRSSRTHVPKRTFSLIDDYPTEEISPTHHSDSPFLSIVQSPSAHKDTEIEVLPKAKLKPKGDLHVPTNKPQPEVPAKKKKKEKRKEGTGKQKDAPKAVPEPSCSSQSDSDRKIGQTSKAKGSKKKKEETELKFVVTSLPDKESDSKGTPKQHKKKQSKESEEKKEGESKSSAVVDLPAKEKVKHKHSKSKKTEQVTSEVKEEDKHIILTLHLPHQEGASHSPYKKHKHKHSHSSMPEEESVSKKKKKKLSQGDIVSSESTDEGRKDAKKISIKFKGLSSSPEKLEVVPEQKTPGKGKVEKEKKEGGKKKKKTLSSAESGEETLSLPKTEEKQPVKLVIKKPKSSSDQSVPKTPQRPKSEQKREATTPQSGKLTPEKKSAATTSKKSKSGSPRKGDNKEKKKSSVTGYLLFCKQERSKIAAANPGLDFPKISSKVGEAWNALPEEKKRFWRNKAEEIKIQMGELEAKKSESSISLPSLEPVDMAAHLKLLGESLSTIGTTLRAQEEMEVHGSLSVLLDSVLCAMCPLMFLTSQVEEINGCSPRIQAQMLDDIAYIMPGLG